MRGRTSTYTGVMHASKYLYNQYVLWGHWTRSLSLFTDRILMRRSGSNGNTYYTANTVYDDSCCSSGGCCENLSQCSQDGSGGSVCDTCSCQCVPGSSPI